MQYIIQRWVKMSWKRVKSLSLTSAMLNYFQTVMMDQSKEIGRKTLLLRTSEPVGACSEIAIHSFHKHSNKNPYTTKLFGMQYPPRGYEKNEVRAIHPQLYLRLYIHTQQYILQTSEPRSLHHHSALFLNPLPQPSSSTLFLNPLPQPSSSTLFLNPLPQPSSSNPPYTPHPPYTSA
jgi:hypothetical protein